MAGLAIQIISSARDSLKNGEIDATGAKHHLIGQLNAAGMDEIAGIIDDFYVSPHLRQRAANLVCNERTTNLQANSNNIYLRMISHFHSKKALEKTLEIIF
ncbi:hypothetical protein NMD73_07765 [Edwardsiella tarda]|uniref:hypothetical protein n=1 Tax=Edwardsiella tarda TaxID=636 RepID=UPI00351C9672